MIKNYAPAPVAEESAAAETDEEEAKQGAGTDGGRRDELQFAPEPVVDARRAQKDLALEQYRAQVQRKQRLDKAQAAPEHSAAFPASRPRRIKSSAKPIQQLVLRCVNSSDHRGLRLRHVGA